MRFTKWLSFCLVTIGALNWGLFGLFKFDLVSFLFGEMTVLSRIIYILIGISAILYSSIVYINGKNNEC